MEARFSSLASRSLNRSLSSVKLIKIMKPPSLLGTLKAYIRGKIISFTSHTNKLRRSQQKELEEAIADLESSLSFANTPDLYKQRIRL